MAESIFPIKDHLPELEIAVKASIHAGKAILEVYSKEFTTYSKSDESPITEADIESNRIIKSILTDTGHAILSEEEKDDVNRLDKKRVWIVDPLDGTTDFVKKTGEFTVMIALVENNIPILGVINWPTENIMYIAQKDRGAYKKIEDSWSRIIVSKQDDISKCKAVGSRHHLSDAEKALLEKLGVIDFTSIGSSLKVCKISSGEADMYITTTNKMKEWDTAASHCIITEAGGKMTTMNGKKMSYNNRDVFHHDGILVTNGIIHDDIVREYKNSKNRK